MGSLDLTADELQTFLPVAIVVAFLLLLTLIILRKGIKIVRHSEVMIVER